MHSEKRSEASVLSASKSSQSSMVGFEESQAEGTHFNSTDDLYEKYFFPIVSKANRTKTVPSVISILEYFFIFIQIYLSGYNDFIPYEYANPSYLTLLNVFYIGLNGEADSVIPSIIALIIIDFVTVLFFLICVIDFQINHEYRKWTLTILRFWHGHLFGVFLIPNFLMILYGFAYLGIHDTATAYIIVVLTTIFGCLAMWIYSTILPFFSRSPYFSPSPVFSCRIKNVYSLLILASVPMGIQVLLNGQFADWIEIIPQFLVVAVFIYCLYECSFYLFQGILFNAMAIGCLSAAIVGSMFSIIEPFTDSIDDLLFYLAPLAVLVVVTIVSYIIIAITNKRIEKQLMFDSFHEPGVKPDEESKKDHLAQLRITNRRKALKYAQIGFEGMCDMFVDWSLFRHYIENFPDDSELMSYMAWIISLFPSEIQFLQKVLTTAMKIVETSVDSKCFLYQIHRIHIFRQSSVSRETSQDFSKVELITNQTINAYCKFWSNLTNPNIDFGTGTYQSLALQKQKADAAWAEALDKYPNNTRFVMGHSIYLLEVGCLFKESIRENQNAKEIDNGLRRQNDKMFHHFVYTHPKYLKKGIVDVRGNLKGPRMDKLKDESSASVTGPTTTKSSSVNHQSTNSNLNSETDSSSGQIDMQEGAQFLPQMNLRLALQRAVTGVKSQIMGRISIFSFFKLILSIAFILLVVFLVKPLFTDRIALFDIFYSIDKVEHSYSLLGIQMPWLAYYGYKDGNPDYSSFLNKISPDQELMHEILDQFETQVNFTRPLRDVVSQISLEVLEDINRLNTLLYQSIDLNNEYLQQFINIFLRETAPSYVCAFLGENITFGVMVDHIPIDYLIRTFAAITREMTLDTDEQIKNWASSSTDHCEMQANGLLIDNLLKKIASATSAPLYYVYQDLTNGNKASSSSKVLSTETFDNSKEDNTTFDYESYEKGQKEVADQYFQKLLNKSRNFLKKLGYNNSAQPFSPQHKLTPHQKHLLEQSMLNEPAYQLEEDEEEEEEEIHDSIDTMCDLIIAISPFFIFLIMLPSIIYLSAGVNYEMSSYSDVFRSISKADCLKASERIKQEVYTDKTKKKADKKSKEKIVTTEGSKSGNYQIWIFDVVSAIIIIAFILVLAIYTKSMKNSIDKNLEYFNLFMAERNLLFSIDKDATYAVLYIDMLTHKETGVTIEAANASLYRTINNMYEYTVISSIINSGDERSGLSTAIDIDDEIDHIRFDPICSDEVSSDNMIEYYKCISLERTISYYIQILDAYIQQNLYLLQQLDLSNPAILAGLNYNLIDTILPFLTHILDTRIAVGFTKIANRFQEIIDSKVNTFNILLIVVAVVSVLFSIATYFIEMMLLLTIHKMHGAFKSLLLRMNPISFVANNQLMSLVYGKNTKDSQIVSASHAVFITSPDAIISLNNEGIIEYLNPATTTIFGFTPEQMLGQHIKMLLNIESKEVSQLFYTMQLMQSGQANLIYECEVNGTRDDDRIVHLKVTLIGFSSNNRLAETFGMTLRDMTLDIKQKTAVEEAKKQSEQLLLQILPKDIIMRLNRGDKDISFTVKSSTIAFMDIEKFSNYSASLNASEIMQNLGLVFTAYDRLLPKYELLIKIKLIGDDYMLAAGLFNPDCDPSEHATQVVSFALECLDAIEDLNENVLNASLQVRIGVNSGGPLIAGVLGTDKPLFDIIGDPINVASRLQSTDIPGFIQISQQSYEYVSKNAQFHIEQRGEVELKGKGKQMTYLVHPHERCSARDKEQSDDSLPLPQPVDSP